MSGDDDAEDDPGEDLENRYYIAKGKAVSFAAAYALSVASADIQKARRAKILKQHSKI